MCIKDAMCQVIIKIAFFGSSSIVMIFNFACEVSGPSDPWNPLWKGFLQLSIQDHWISIVMIFNFACEVSGPSDPWNPLWKGFLKCSDREIIKQNECLLEYRGNTGCTRLSLYCPGIIRTFNPDHKLLNMPKQSKREMSDKLRSGSHNEGVIIGHLRWLFVADAI